MLKVEVFIWAAFWAWLYKLFPSSIIPAELRSIVPWTVCFGPQAVVGTTWQKTCVYHRDREACIWSFFFSVKNLSFKPPSFYLADKLI